jgi:UDP-N-acetyl-D-glucosamine dehydrogenase
MAFRPGPGLGGHCIPIDPFYLTWKAREFGKHTRFIELAGEINTAMPDYVISKVADALNDEAKAINGAKVLVLGLAYKANVDDCRESPSFVLMEKLEAKGAKVEYNDSFVPVVPPTREHAHFTGKKSVEIQDAYDLILVSTDHKEYKTFDFSNYACPLVDSRNCITKKPAKYYQA